MERSVPTGFAPAPERLVVDCEVSDIGVDSETCEGEIPRRDRVEVRQATGATTTRGARGILSKGLAAAKSASRPFRLPSYLERAISAAAGRHDVARPRCVRMPVSPAMSYRHERVRS